MSLILEFIRGNPISDAIHGGAYAESGYERQLEHLGEAVRMKQVLRRWLAGLLSVIMLFGLLPSSVYATPSAGFTSAESGTGEEGNPYIIASADQLAALSEYVNSGKNCSGLHFRLKGDIELGGSADHNGLPLEKTTTINLWALLTVMVIPSAGCISIQLQTIRAYLERSDRME